MAYKFSFLQQDWSDSWCLPAAGMAFPRHGVPAALLGLLPIPAERGSSPVWHRRRPCGVGALLRNPPGIPPWNKAVCLASSADSKWPHCFYTTSRIRKKLYLHEKQQQFPHPDFSCQAGVVALFKHLTPTLMVCSCSRLCWNAQIQSSPGWEWGWLVKHREPVLALQGSEGLAVTPQPGALCCWHCHLSQHTEHHC